MKSMRAAAAALFVTALTIAGCGHLLPSDGWVVLIDGEKGLENFDRIGDANWRAEKGAIVADKGKGGHLVTKNSYKDFEIYAEFWAETTTNSGIFIRASNPKQVGADNAYEVNIFDQRPGQEYSTGAIVNYAVVNPPYPRAGGRWNTFRITARGPEVTVAFNGNVTVHMNNREFAQGPFTLQYGAGAKDAPGGQIRWRMVAVRPL